MTPDVAREVIPAIARHAAYDTAGLFEQRERERFTMHSRHLNEQMVRVLKAIGYDIGFCRGTGQYLYDRKGTRYLDLLSGFGVFAVGRNHPALREALRSVLDAELPNLVQMDVSTLAGVLAGRILELSLDLQSPIASCKRNRPILQRLGVARHLYQAGPRVVRSPLTGEAIANVRRS
jgi:Aminotransferase class-III